MQSLTATQFSWGGGGGYLLHKNIAVKCFGFRTIMILIKIRGTSKSVLVEIYFRFCDIFFCIDEASSALVLDLKI